MDGINDHIKRIEEKLQQLLKEYHYARKEIERLTKENNRLREQLTVQEEHASRLHQKADALIIASGSLGESSKKDLEKRIDIYLKDIEKCLALLHS